MNDTFLPGPDDDLDKAIACILARPIPEFPNPTIVFPQTGRSSNMQTHANPRWLSRQRRIATVGGLSLATAAVLAAATFFVWPTNAWAQVVEAVRKQPWVRLRFQMPGNPSGGNSSGGNRSEGNPAAKNQPSFDIWFSAERQIVAGRVPGSTVFVELNRQRKQRFDAATRTIYVSDSDSNDEEELASLNAVLQSFNARKELQRPDAGKAKLLSQSRQEGREGDRAWTDFVFTYEDARRTPSQYRRVFHVPAGVELPTSMAEEWTYDGKTHTRMMQMDYPEFGPADLFALDVPQDARIVDAHSSNDLKSVLKAYAAQQAADVGAYSALALRSVVAKPDWKWVNEIYKVRHNASGYTSEVSDLDQMLKLALRVHGGELPVPEATIERLEWWKTQTSKLKFTPFGGATAIQVFVPDRVGFPELGLPNEAVHATLDSRPSLGPSETVLVTIADVKTGTIKSRYWLAPNRGFLCCRSELHPSSGYLPEKADWIATTVVDAAEKSPTGRWYATQVRAGVVKQSGDDLQPGTVEPGAPYAASTWRFLVEFEKIRDNERGGRQ